MVLDFNFQGDFSEFVRDDLCFGAIEFDTDGKHYIVDLVGEVDYDFSKDEISGRFKGEMELLSPEEPLTEEELTNIILSMDKNTFKYNIFDDGWEPDFRKFEGQIYIDKQELQIDRIGKQPMTVRQFFDLLRKYPDWDKDIVIENQKTKMLDDIVDIVCDERNGNLIIVKREN